MPNRRMVCEANSLNRNRLMIMDGSKICLVCGFPKLTEGPFDDYGCPTYEICPCCGFEFGFDDESEGISYVEYREKWIAGGFHWFREDEEPTNWDRQLMEKQLSNSILSKAKSRYVANI